MKNIPIIKLGIISVSRDCFPIALSESRRHAAAAAFGEGLYECPICVECETDAMRAVDDVKAAGVNALCVFLGNFGPESSETIIAKLFDGPVMYAAAADGDGDLFGGRGDAYCGMLNCSYNLGLRNLRAHIPSRPVGSAEEVAEMIREFIPIATAVIGISKLKIITFGPRPQDFLACNAPIKPLFDLGVEIEENSELDLLVSFNSHAGDSRIPSKIKEMREEVCNCAYPDILPKLAQYELTLLDWAEKHKGQREYVAFADKCWPAFQTEFGFVPCYVNSRLTGIYGIPVSCEVDIYGALSEYIGLCATGSAVTLLDINNTVPRSIYKKSISKVTPYKCDDVFMGFHCGNTCSSLLKNPHIAYQLIMKRNLEPETAEPNITRGTIEGDIKAGDVTVYRLQSTADGKLRAYAAQGEVLDVPTESFGGIGIIAIPEMGRFYRNVLIDKQYPHHTAVAFGHHGKALFNIFEYLNVSERDYNHPSEVLYPKENPFA